GALVMLLSAILAVAGRAKLAGQEANAFSAVVLILGFSLALAFPGRVFTGILNSNIAFAWTSGLELGMLAIRTLLVVVMLTRGHGIVGLALATLMATVPHFLLSAYLAFRHNP